MIEVKGDVGSGCMWRNVHGMGYRVVKCVGCGVKDAEEGYRE